MNSLSLSPNLGAHLSAIWVESRVCPTVRYQVARLSLGRRIELTRRVRDLWERLQFHEAGGSTSDRLASALLAAELDREYLKTGLLQVEGLTIDDKPVSVESLIDLGPEALCQEIVASVKQELGLSEEERKN